MKVSICIPAYRQVEFLRETLRSVEEQDFTDYEIIVSDDSNDSSVRDLLTEFSFGDKLHYVHNSPSLGSPRNWNAAVNMARGEYVKILHHDDHFTRRDALGLFVKLLEDSPDADFGFSATLVHHVDSGLKRIHCPDDKQIADLKTDPASLFLGNCIGAPSATISRRTANLNYDERMKWLVDIDYYFRTLMRNRQFAFTPEALISTPTNATHQVTEICRDDIEVELGEAMLLFERFGAEQRENPVVKRGWMNLFRRFKIRRLGQLTDYGIFISGDREYFSPLMRRRWWSILMDPRLAAKKVFYRLYPHVPAPVRHVLKSLHFRVVRR